MRTYAIVFIGLVLADPSWAQQLAPAVDGTGSQTQSLELLDGNVSATVDSSGSLSAGRGSNSADGMLGVTINDASVTIGGQSSGSSGTNSGAHPGVTRPTPTANTDQTRPSPGTSQPLIDLAATVPDCEFAPLDNRAIAYAVDRQLPVNTAMTDCAERDDRITRLIADNPEFNRMIFDAGVDLAKAVSITITNDAVIVGLSSTL